MNENCYYLKNDFFNCQLFVQTSEAVIFKQKKPSLFISFTRVCDLSRLGFEPWENGLIDLC